jgi:hypothetical protein
MKDEAHPSRKFEKVCRIKVKQNLELNLGPLYEVEVSASLS